MKNKMKTKHPFREEHNSDVELIGFMIQGDYIIVSNPCTIPIKFMKEALKKKRKKDEVTSVGLISLPFKYLKQRKTKTRK